MPDRLSASGSPDETAASDDAWRRPVVGLLAVGCLAAMLWVGPTYGWNSPAAAPLVRIGVLLATAWLAWPAIERLTWRSLRKGGFVVALGAVALSAFRPRVFLPMLAVLFALTWWRRRSQRKRDVRQARSDGG